jgi:DNA polymerase-3 subunit delta
VLNRARSSVSRTSTEALRKSLDVLVETDEKLKSVSVNQRFLIEQLISRLLLIAKEGRI